MGDAGQSQTAGRSAPRRRRELWNASPEDSHTQDESESKDVGSMMRTPIILAKPPCERTGGALPLPPAPALLLSKPRDEDPAGGAAAAGGGGGSPPPPPAPGRTAAERPAQPLYQIHNRSAVQTPGAGTAATTAGTAGTGGDAGTAGPPPRVLQTPERMRHSVKLVDECMTWCDTALEMLLDQTDFLVVGVVGPQGVGKSTLMSLLAANSADDDPRLHVFRSQSQETSERGAHHSLGVDLYVSQERVIFLDTQPILSGSVLDHFISNERKLPQEFTLPHTFVEVHSVQLVALLLTVCHVLLVVQDSAWDPRLYRFLRTAEMLKPACSPPTHETVTAVSGDEASEHFPHLVFVHNRASREDFSPRRVLHMEQMAAAFMRHSNLKHRGLVSMPGFPAPSQVSIFLLPGWSSEEAEERNPRCATGMFSLLPCYRGHAGFPTLIAHLRNQILSSPRSPLTHTTLTEKNWFHFAARIWEVVRKSPLMSEYGRLLA